MHDAQAEQRILALERPAPALLVLYGIRSLAGLFLAPLIFIPLFFRYHTLRYRFDSEGVSASWGILFRREIHLTYKRIQDIHVQRSLVQRWLGIATVEVQTASGSQDAELAVEGVVEYEALRDFLYGRMRGHEFMSGQGAQRPAAEAPAGDRVAELLEQIQRDLEGTRAALERPRA